MTDQGSIFAYLTSQPLVALALAGLVLAGLGWRLERPQARLGGHLLTAGYLAFGSAALLIVIDVIRQTKDSDIALQLIDRTEARVIGRETVIPLGPDGHYHAIAEINGHQVSMLIDTGASFTTLEQATARPLGLAPSQSRLPADLVTANGVIQARFAIARQLRLGSIDARDLEVAITPDTASPQAVVGMDLLSKLQSWRVEGGELHLVPAGS